MNVLITSASRKVSLVKSFMTALAAEGGGKVIAADASPLAAALYFADEHHLVPKSQEPGFVDTMIALCRSLSVGLLIPTRDEELPVYAQHKEAFAEIGVMIMASSPEAIRLCQDKRAFLEFCRDRGFAVPKTYADPDSLTDSDFPVFVKPRTGKGSRQTERVGSKQELAIVLRGMGDAIIQEYIDLPEFTIDLFADFNGVVISAVPRERIYTFGGESFITRTVNDSRLIQEAERLATELRLIGHNTIQCFYDGERVRFIEVNPRFGGAAHLGFAAGADTPRFLIKLLTNQPVEPQLGRFKDDYYMLRFTEDIFMPAESLDS